MGGHELRPVALASREEEQASLRVERLIEAAVAEVQQQGSYKA